MALKALTAEDRRSPEHAKDSFLIVGPYGVGKTSLLNTLPGPRTLAIDIEGGLKSADAGGWNGTSVSVASFQDFQDMAVLIAGPHPAIPQNRFLSQNHYNHVRDTHAGTVIEQYAKLPIIFVDSITVLTRLAFMYAQQQPEAFSEKTGKADTRGAYGLLGREVVGTLQHLQNARGKTVILVGLLEEKVDEYGRRDWVPQMEGSKIGRELPGIVDNVLSMCTFSRGEDGVYVLDEKAEERRFVCRKANPYGLPAKERSAGRLGVTEAPDLGALLTKINSTQ
jgi:hypothetical protein